MISKLCFKNIWISNKLLISYSNFSMFIILISTHHIDRAQLVATVVDENPVSLKTRHTNALIHETNSWTITKYFYKTSTHSTSQIYTLGRNVLILLECSKWYSFQDFVFHARVCDSTTHSRYAKPSMYRNQLTQYSAKFSLTFVRMFRPTCLCR